MKHPGGGRYDPADRPIFFFVGLEPWSPTWRPPHTLFGLNDVLDTGGVEELAERIAHGAVLLDSGIYSLAHRHAGAHGMPLPEALTLPPDALDGFAPLRAAYVETVKRYEADLWGYVELDLGGPDVKRQTRRELEAEGVVPIPVYHPLTDGWDYFDELCSGYDRVCVGNIVHAPYPVRRRLLHTLWERRRAYPDVWVHLLGLTPTELVGSLPFESCDSSTFVGALRFGPRTTPFAVSALHRMGQLTEEFNYPGDRAGQERAAEMGMTGSVHLGRAWRAQVDAAGELSPAVPALQPWEPQTVPAGFER